MLTVRVGDTEYRFDLDEQLNTLTGLESAEVEDFLGGWDKLDANKTKGMIFMVWLAKRSAGETDTLADVASIPGLLFGGVAAIADDGDSPVDTETAEFNELPLATKNGSRPSRDGDTGSAAGTETSAGTGVQS